MASIIIHKPKLLGFYLSCSRDEIKKTLQIKRDIKVQGEERLLGELLVEYGYIEKRDLEIGLIHQRADRLGLCPIFETLTRQELIAISRHFQEMSIAANQVFIMEGESDPTLYVLASGKVEIYHTGIKNRKVHIAYSEPYDPIGEMGYFQGGIRAASVKAVQPTDVLYAAYSNMTHYFEEEQHVAYAFLEVVNRRQQEIEEKLKAARQGKQKKNK